MANIPTSIYATAKADGLKSATNADVPLVYLGKSIKEELYYFLSVKDGVGRFLRFGFAPYYPFWIGGVNTGATHSVPDRLLLTECPQGAVEEVQLFVNGKVKYEFEPSRKGRKAKVTKIMCSGVGDEAGGPTGSNGGSSNGPSGKPDADQEKVLPNVCRASGRGDETAKLGNGSGRESGRGRAGGVVGNSRQLPRQLPVSSTGADSASRRGRPLKVVAPVAKPVVPNEAVVRKQKKPEIEVAQTVTVPKRGRGRPVGSTNKKPKNPNSGRDVTSTMTQPKRSKK